MFLDALGTDRIPDPTTAGDFCRRFDEGSIRNLIDAIDEARLNAWARQPEEFFERATIDMDGTLVVTTGECKQDMKDRVIRRREFNVLRLQSEEVAQFEYKGAPGREGSGTGVSPVTGHPKRRHKFRLTGETPVPL